ncbi:MAG: plastocyanin/azurin family copper-binding protein [Actinomycetota bacterium]
MPAEFEVTFDQPGTYGYFCIPHEGSNMTGSVWVEE